MLHIMTVQAADSVILVIWSHVSSLMYEKQILHSKTLCQCPSGAQIDYQSHLHLYLTIHLDAQKLISY